MAESTIVKTKRDGTITFLDNGVLRTESKITSFTFFEHETNLNDAKRNITPTKFTNAKRSNNKYLKFNCIS